MWEMRRSQAFQGLMAKRFSTSGVSCEEQEDSIKNISHRIRKNMPADDSKTIPVPRSVLTTPLARRIPPRQARDRDLSSRGPCQHRTFKQAKTTQQTQSITKLFGTQIDKSN